MKKTSFTYAKIRGKRFRGHVSRNPLSAVFMVVMMLFGNFAFGQIMDPCPPGSGNSVTNCPAVGPHTVFADANCQSLVPDFKPGVSGIVGPGYIWVGVVQVPMAGDVVNGLGNYNVQVGAAFLDQTGGPNNGTLCADVCPDITVSVQDNTPPVAVCVAGPVVMSADANCEVVFTQANILANFFVFPPTDNCGPITYSASPTSLAGPVCGGGNPTLLTNVTITATDGAGNPSVCVVPTQVVDNTPPTVAICPPNDTVSVSAAIGVCQGITPNYTGLVGGITDNCDPGPVFTIMQSPAPGTIFNIPTGCGTFDQPTAVTVADCFGNTAVCDFIVTFVDDTPPVITSPCPAPINLITNANCEIFVPDLTGGMTAQDNCAMPASITFSQDPPVGLLDVSGLCPPNNTVTVTLTATDCNNNSSDQVCTALITFTDLTPPQIVCPANPIPVIIPFNSITCEHGTAFLTLADVLAAGVTITDACDPDPQLTSVDPNMFMCPDIGKAGLTVTINGEDCFGNPTSETCAVTVLAPDNLTAAWSIPGGDFIVCPSEFPIEIILGPNTPACGTWSGDVVVSVGGTPTNFDFTNAYNVSNWTIDLNGSATAEVNTTGAPASIFMVSSNDGFGPSHVTSFTITIPVATTLAFNWDYSSANSSPLWDPFGYSINGTYTQLTDDAGPLVQNGTAMVPVNAGDVFAFEARSEDQCCGAATTIISSFAAAGNIIYTLDASSFPDLDNDGVPDPGAYSLTYTVGAPGCHVSETHNIQVSPTFLPGDADLVPDFSICWEATETFDLEGLLAPGSIQGGLYTILLGGNATGQQIGNLFQYLGGDGTLTVTYELIDCDGNIVSDQVVISIDEKPAGYFSLPANFCQDEGAAFPVITGVPAGATISFASIPAGFITDPLTGLFNPLTGPLSGEFVDVFVTMTVTNGVCAPYNISQWIVVYASGDPAFTIPATICESDPPLVLLLDNPLNDGGVNPLIASNVTWTGTSVTDFGTSGAFNPAVGPGVYTICVTVGAPSCDEILCKDITVEPDYTAADVALVADFSLCLLPDDVISFSSLLAATAKPGGTFTVVEAGDLNGNGIVNANGYVYKGECGTLTITHFFPDDCVPTQDQITITIEQKPDVGGLAIPGPLCAQDGPAFIEYSGTPIVCGVPGTFTAPFSPVGTIVDFGTGQTAAFNPVAAGEGLHLIQYEIGNPLTGCYSTLFGWIEVRASSDPGFTTPSTACANEVITLVLDNPDPSVLPSSPDGHTEIFWFGGDGLNGVVTDNGDGTGTFVGYVGGTYTICVQTGDLGCNQYFCRQITVDIIPPVLDCGPLVRTRSNDLGLCTYEAQGTEFDVTATDNCIPPNGAASLILTHNYAPHVGTNANSLEDAIFPVGITQVMWTATDTAGNSANCTIQIVVNDDEDAQVQSCPADILQGTDSTTCGAIITYAIPQFSDNCDGVDLEGVLVSGYAPGTLFPLGVTTVTWIYTDLAGNATATCTFTVTIEDDIDPIAVCQPAIDVVLDGDGLAQLLTTAVDLGSYDNCGVVSRLISRDSVFFPALYFGCADIDPALGVGIITVTLEVEDAAGNSSQCTSTITVYDLQVPDIECPGNYTVLADMPTCSAVVNYPAPTVTDNCSFTVTQIDTSGLTSGDAFPVGTTVQTYQVTDIAGNTETCSFTIFVYDEVPPTLICGPLVRTQAADLGLCSFTAPGAGFDPTFTDNCPGGTITHNYPLAVNPNTLAGSTFPVGTTLVTWIATDASGNQSDICGIQIVITDNENPTITCGGNLTVNTDPGLCSFKVTSTAADPIFNDNCPGAILSHDFAMAPNSNTANGATFPLGTTVVTWTVTDASGNTATCSYSITVVDNEAPAFVNCPTTMVMIGNDPDLCSGKLNWSIPVATDNCGIQSVVQTGGPANGTFVPVGAPQTVTYTATDINGNTATCVFQVQVVDTQKPKFDADIVMPTNITVECNAIPTNCVFKGNGICAPLTLDDVNDNCPGPLTITFTETSTQNPNPNVCGHYNYTITRTWTVTDVAGNQLVHVQVITVQDTTPPVPVCQNTTITLDKAGNASINPSTLIAGTTDNCAPFSALTVTASQTAFTCANLGQNNVTLTITDPCGNSATCNIIVTVQEGIGPCTPQATLVSTCLNNATTLTNGQFAELITIKSLAMQTWTVTSSTGLFTAGSASPPAAPTAVPNGTPLIMGTADGIDNDGNGQIDEPDEMIFYTLNAKWVEAIGYSATLTNNLGQTVTISNVGHYPTPILTDFYPPFCLNTPAFIPQVIDQFAGAGAYNNVTFLINGQPATQINPATLGVGQHLLTIIADAGTAAFSRRVNGVLVTGDAANSDEARLNPGCIQSVDVFFQVVTTPTQVVCNDLINVTLEPNCTSVITPDMVLEGTYACFDDYQVHIYLPNGIPLNPPNVLTGAHVGQNLQYTLHHPISGNACWGNINLEDKTPPTATCPQALDILCTINQDSIVLYLPPNHPRFPARDIFGNLVPVNGSLLYTGQPTATDCSTWTWAYTDDFIVNDCAQNPSVVIAITRTFVITDAHGNQTTCTQSINKLRGEASQVVIPKDTTFACNNPILATIAPAFPPSVTGWPQIAGINITTNGTGICGLGVTYTDEIVNLCAASYKVVRTWKIFDWCPASGGAPTTTTFTQYIKVENLPPTISINCQTVNSQGFCVLNATQSGNPPHTLCSANYVPLATVDGVCDGIVSVKVETPAGFTTNGGYIPSPGLPLGGPYDLIYRVEDECGNITQFVLTVVVEDKTAPVAICDLITDVNLTANGQAIVFAETFDDGSYDNCCVDRFEVRRMTAGCGTGTSFGPTVTFCCDDIANNPITVVFRVVDCNGNTNECMVQAYVNDKLPPLLVNCPAGQRVTCDWYADNLETQLAALGNNQAAQSQLLDQYFGTPTFQDNCNVNLNRTFNRNIDQCLEGTITRSWTAVDPSNNQSVPCTQTIFVDHVSDWVVEFPADITVNCGTTVPDFGEPEIFFETCELVGVSYQDEIFTVVPDACYKLLRTWTVINWCVVGAEIDQEVVESSERDFQLAGILPFPACDFDGDGDCDTRTFRDSWRVSPLAQPGAAQANQQFGPDTDPDSDPWDGYITYQQVIKVNDTVDPVFTNGCQIPDVCIEDNTCSAIVVFPTPEISDCSPSVTFTVTSQLGSGFGPFSNVAPGTYNVTYNVKDNCNNQTNCSTTVTVKDCKKPTPYCKNGLVIELMQTGMVEIWAVDFNAGSFDNCTPQDQLKFSFSANVNETGRTYNCDHVGQQVVQMWVTDLAGNQDFCETFVIVQDNMNACVPGGNPLVAGLIQTEQQVGVANVNVQLSGTSQASMMTTSSGMFSFPVIPGGDYTVVPVKDDNPLNGVTTFDLVLITRHILGSQLLDSPYKIIAADANKSNTVTTFDLVQLRRLILFIDTEFPNNTSWRFVPKSYVFPNPANPWSQTFPEVININNISASQLATDFVAVKIGDVNGSAQPNLDTDPEERNATGSLIFAVDNAIVAAGQEHTVEFKARDFDVLGYQFTLNFDRTSMEFVRVNPAVAGAENFGLTMLDKGVITASWNDNDTRLADDEVVFSLVFKAIATARLSDVFSVNSRYTAAEAYKRNGELLDVQLAFTGSQVAGNFELYQNAPNPFTVSTVIGFNLPEATSATLTITDVSGRIVKMVKGDYAKGYNQVTLERRELPASGILYYQLDTQSDSATKMMLLMD